MSEIVRVQNEQAGKKIHSNFLRNLHPRRKNNDINVTEAVIVRKKTLRNLRISKIQKKKQVTEVLHEVDSNETKKKCNTRRVLTCYFRHKK